MIQDTIHVEYGRPASEALAAVIAAAQCDDALAPVTVIVPSNFVGLSARRLLGSGEVGGRSGLANVSFVTPFQLAERVAADLLLDTRPITNPVLGAAVRGALADHASDGGVYGSVFQHEATEAAMAASFAELSNVDEVGIEAIREEGSIAALLAVEMYERIEARLVGFHTERDLVSAAAGRADLAVRLEPFGHIVWFLPAPASSALTQLIGRVLSDAPSSVVVGVTGDADADEPVWRAAEAAGVSRVAAVSIGIDRAAVADAIVSVTDAAEEVREMCARVVGLIEQGVAPDRIGVFMPTPDPYVRIIEQQFAAASITINGPDPRRLADSAAGRTLLAALEMPQVRWRRDRVIALVSGGPVRNGDRRVRPVSWDRLSREAGVIGGLGDWSAKLERHRDQTRARLDELAADPSADASAAERRRLRFVDRLNDIDELRQFLDALAESISAIASAPTWSEKCASTRRLLVTLLGPENQHSGWPEAEQEAFERVDEAIGRLAALDEIEPTLDHQVFLRALRSELDVARGRRGRFGHGVFYGPLTAAVGHDFDAVFVLGAAEGLLPAPRRDDAILPDRVRLCSLDQLEPRIARLHHQHRAFIAALASAPVGARTLLFPRGSLRSSRRALPSRWLLDTASALAGDAVHATDFENLSADAPAGVVQTIGSFSSGIVGSDAATGVDERDLVAIGLDADIARHPLAELVGSGIEMQRERSSDRFTAYDGNLADVDVTIGDRAMSPSRLESWASCGFRYFLRYVLDVGDRDDPERTDDLSPLDKGNLVHAILEQFVQEAIERGAPDPDTSWSDADRERLHEIAAEIQQTFEDMGRTGRAVSWRVQRDDMRALLDRFIEFDDRFRSETRATPIEVEADFGIREGRPVELTLPGGRSIHMRGKADRIDTTAHGRVLVSDYKTGKPDRYTKLREDQFREGTTLQLGMYSEGALQSSFGESVSAHYAMVDTAEVARFGYEWTSDLRSRFDEVLGAIIDGIEGGVFASAPGEWSSFLQTNEACTYCDYDSVCPRERGEQAEAKAHNSEVQIRLRLQPPVAPSADEVES